MYACIILHNIILQDEGRVICHYDKNKVLLNVEGVAVDTLSIRPIEEKHMIATFMNPFVQIWWNIFTGLTYNPMSSIDMMICQTNQMKIQVCSLRTRVRIRITRTTIQSDVIFNNALSFLLCNFSFLSNEVCLYLLIFVFIIIFN